MSDYVGEHHAVIEHVEPERDDDGWTDKEHYDDTEYDDWDDEVDDEELDALLAPEPEQGVEAPPQDTGNPGPEPIPDAIQFAVAALMDRYTYDQIRDAVERLHEARAHLATAFSVYLTRDGSTLVNTDVLGVSVDREASTEDMRRAARDVAEFHEHQRIAAMVRAVL